MGKRRRQFKLKKPIDLFFEIAISVCCIVMIFALIIFVISCFDLSHTINGLVDAYGKYIPVMGHITDKTNARGISSDETYMENLIDYALKLQELEAKSASTNVITFIYTFISGALIGVATYFAKKSEESVKQIQENKELIMNLDNRTLFSNFYMYAQRTYSTIQIFDLSLDAIQDRKVLKNFVDKNITTINNVINEINVFTKKNESNIRQLSKQDKENIIEEINKIGKIVSDMHDPENNDSIADIYNEFIRAGWEKQINAIRQVLKE